MQTNADGFVAVRQFRQSDKLVEVHGRGYVFIVRASISLAYIHPDDLDAVLNFTYDCGCGGQPKIGFGLASEQDARIWNAGGGN